MANEVVINVTADTKKAGKGLDNIRDKMKKVGAGATIAGGLITGFAAKSLSEFTSMGDEIHKMALRTGFSTETLSELRVAADLSGTSLTALETGIKKMQISIVDAGDGLATATDQFDKLGISAEDLKGLSPEKQFDILTKALSKLKTQEEKTAVAMKVFGKAGTDMLPMLAGGEEGLEAMKQQAHELGLVFDQEAAEKAAKLNDAMSTMKGSMTGVMLMVAESLAPIITKLAITIEKAISKVTAWTEENPKLTAVIVPIIAAIGGVLLVAGPLLLAFSAITTIAPFVAGAFAIMTGPIGIIILAIAALGLAWATNFGGIRDKTEAVFGFITNLYSSKLGWLLPGGALIKGLLFLKDNWKSIWDGISSAFRGTVNTLIGLINVFIDAVNRIRIDIPAFKLPDALGGHGFPGLSVGFNLQRIATIKAPAPKTQTHPMHLGGGDIGKTTSAMEAERFGAKGAAVTEGVGINPMTGLPYITSPVIYTGPPGWVPDDVDQDHLGVADAKTIVNIDGEKVSSSVDGGIGNNALNASEVDMGVA